MRRLEIAAICLALVALAFVQFNDVWLWQAKGDPPRRADVVVAIGGENGVGRLRLAEALVREGYSRTLFTDIPGQLRISCRRPGVPRTICFSPNPVSTRGEAEAVARMARTMDWRSVLLVVSTDQANRARVRFGRCLSGPLDVVTVPTPPNNWTYITLYQDAATAKAEIWQRGC